MPLPRDPEILRVPAFMRKRSIRARLKRPLLLTALDRKNAGVLPDGLADSRKARKAAARPQKVHKLFPDAPRKQNISRPVKKSPRQSFGEFPIVDGYTEPKIKRPKRTRKPKVSKPAENVFSAPLLDFYSTPSVKPEEVEEAISEPKSSNKKIGTVTHYYDKIKVGVIKLSGTLSVGDCITYDTADGKTYEQVVESMEIDREPVFKAVRGKEIGLKLHKIPRIDGEVFK